MDSHVAAAAAFVVLNGCMRRIKAHKAKRKRRWWKTPLNKSREILNKFTQSLFELRNAPRLDQKQIPSLYILKVDTLAEICFFCGYNASIMIEDMIREPSGWLENFLRMSYTDFLLNKVEHMQETPCRKLPIFSNANQVANQLFSKFPIYGTLLVYSIAQGANRNFMQLRNVTQRGLTVSYDVNSIEPVVFGELSLRRAFLKKTITVSGSFNVEEKRTEDYCQMNMEANSHRKMHSKIREEEVPHHTFPLPSERNIHAVIRGVHATLSETEIKEELQQRGYSPLHIIRLKRGGGVPMPLVVVILPKIEKSQQLFNEHELLGPRTIALNIAMRHAHYKKPVETRKYPQRQRYYLDHVLTRPNQVLHFYIKILLIPNGSSLQLCMTDDMT
ncbi:unnamed protein product [Acanthoscelides obtectus]|uniref:Uncharacterized protein n=1 Tax=Acanthoscelides obtectus TaxID=200917 RepID=A0A9P0KJ62_ACAOB|nr:unnamed protein product [Acanthoscelides obtectus]CAK1640045.1 hypothetical protein AOBTE_LOCUS11526 [Acanthoscelides obtectus]